MRIAEGSQPQMFLTPLQFAHVVQQELFPLTDRFEFPFSNPAVHSFPKAASLPWPLCNRILSAWRWNIAHSVEERAGSSCRARMARQAALR